MAANVKTNHLTV